MTDRKGQKRPKQTAPRRGSDGWFPFPYSGWLHFDITAISSVVGWGARGVAPRRPALMGLAGSIYKSAASSVVVTSVAPNSRMRRWHPALAAEVTGPGTAPSGRPRAIA